ncbi:MAG: Flp family type IVb pilin [Alphaproteobacteria bacterium]
MRNFQHSSFGPARFLRSESGATAIEYGLIAMLVSVALIAALWAYSEAVGDVYALDAKAIDTVVAEH